MDTADLQRARQLVALDRDAQARELLARFLADDPENPQGLCLMAQACLGVGDKQAAIAAASAACRSAPDDEWAHRLLALALARSNRYDEAWQVADRAIRLDPGSWRTHLVRAQVDAITDRITAGTESAARTAVRLAPHESECHRMLGNVLLAQGRQAQAEAALREALRLDPQSAPARNDLARVHIRRRDLGRAAAGFADAAALNPADQVAAGNLVVVGAKALRVVHLIMWVVLIVVGRLVAETHGSHRAEVAIGFGVSAAALAAFAVLIWRGARPRTVRLIRIILSRDRLLAGWAGCLVVAFVMFGVAAAAPGAATTPALGVSLGALFIGILLGWARRRRFF